VQQQLPLARGLMAHVAAGVVAGDMRVQQPHLAALGPDYVSTRLTALTHRLDLRAGERDAGLDALPDE
jgi:hypothetical protein